jgi:uncharacterized protein
MSKPKWFFGVFTETGPLIVLAVATTLLVGIVGPASAQFFNFGGPPRGQPRSGGFGGGWFGGDIFSPFQQQIPRQQAPRHRAPRQVLEDFSKAPSPEKRDTVAERNVLLLGDAMADWLAYGLEDAYAEQPDIGVIRRHKTVSGLIKYQPKGEPADWAAAAKGILATEKPDAIVVMLGLDDRAPIRDPGAEKSDKKSDKRDGRGPSDGKPPGKPASKPDGLNENAAKPDAGAVDAELSGDGAADDDATPLTSADKSTRSATGVYHFREERWVELYTKKIEQMIAILKSKGVPVLWVGLPAVRGAKATSDTLFLNSLYRNAAGKAGITYVDIWDGFVDEAGHFLQQGPDFEGQIRRLRSYDGVYFTKAGARKLAHFVEREITRLLAAHSPRIALPTEPASPDANAVTRPLAGPIVPLEASSVGTDQLLGGPASRPPAVDALAARTLLRGEPLTPPAGRADDFVWPRREVGHQPLKSETPLATTLPDALRPVMARATPPKPKKLRHAKPRTLLDFGPAQLAAPH